MALAIVRSAAEIDRFHGRAVKIVGTYKAVRAQKGGRGPIVAEVTIEDGTGVIIGYGPPTEQFERFDGRKVSVIGTIYRTSPDEARQWLVAPHMTDIQVLEEAR